jgi:hypothetical protein
MTSLVSSDRIIVDMEFIHCPEKRFSFLSRTVACMLWKEEKGPGNLISHSVVKEEIPKLQRIVEICKESLILNKQVQGDRIRWMHILCTLEMPDYAIEVMERMATEKDIDLYGFFLRSDFQNYGYNVASAQDAIERVKKRVLLN